MNKDLRKRVIIYVHEGLGEHAKGRGVRNLGTWIINDKANKHCFL